MNVNVTHLNSEHAPDQPRTTKVLVLNCMDRRLVDPVADYLDRRGLRGHYDQIVLAGGAIGVMSDQTSAWAVTFWEHVRLARDLDDIAKIIIIDHRDCRACDGYVSRIPADLRERETVAHMVWMEALADEIKTREPGIDVELLLMDLDGSVEAFDA